MTREFNKEQRDDSRPPFRKPSSSRFGEERSPRPARPRLNRETVDRAWESGAQPNHADYRPRSNQGGQPPRTNRYSNQPSEYNSFQNGRGNSRPYGNRQENYRDNNPRRFERTPEGPRSQSFNAPDRRNGNDQGNQRFNDRRGYSDGPNDRGARPNYRDNTQPRNRAPQYGDRDQNRGGQRGDYNQRDHRSPRPYERDDQQRDTRNPRWQSRPAPQRDYAPRESQESTRRPPYGKQFEGDYEHFDNASAPQRPPRPSGQPFRNSREPEAREAPERHVTRLPDGRVLKGSRPEQRKKAQFWQGVTEDTESLVSQIEVPPTKAQDETPPPIEAVEAEATTQEEDQAATLKKRRARPASAVARGKKNATTKPDGTVPRPSRRGFKWPAP